MILELQNIGMLRSAKIGLNGLTVIAGENDTGKSTIGKALFTLIKADMISLFKVIKGQATSLEENRRRVMNKQIELVFNGSICNVNTSNSAHIKLFNQDNILYEVKFKKEETNKDQCIHFSGPKKDDIRYFKDALIIQTPLVWDLYETLSDIATLNQESDLLGLATKIRYPYFLWDLYTKIRPKEKDDEIFFIDIYRNITNDILLGEIIQENQNKVIFQKQSGVKLPITNLATGSKSFLILQMLLKNNMIEPARLMIIDEPEVHLHPKWQLEYAKIIISLVKQDIKVIVATHSPYIIEALKRYSEKEEISEKLKFYLVENYIAKEQETLENIFEKLAVPMRELKQIKMEKFYQ